MGGGVGVNSNETLAEKPWSMSVDALGLTVTTLDASGQTVENLIPMQASSGPKNAQTEFTRVLNNINDMAKSHHWPDACHLETLFKVLKSANDPSAFSERPKTKYVVVKEIKSKIDELLGKTVSKTGPGEKPASIDPNQINDPLIKGVFEENEGLYKSINEFIASIDKDGQEKKARRMAKQAQEQAQEQAGKALFKKIIDIGRGQGDFQNVAVESRLNLLLEKLTGIDDQNLSTLDKARCTSALLDKIGYLTQTYPEVRYLTAEESDGHETIEGGIKSFNELAGKHTNNQIPLISISRISVFLARTHRDPNSHSDTWDIIKRRVNSLEWKTFLDPVDQVANQRDVNQDKNPPLNAANLLLSFVRAGQANSAEAKKIAAAIAAARPQESYTGDTLAILIFAIARANASSLKPVFSDLKQRVTQNIQGILTTNHNQDNLNTILLYLDNLNALTQESSLSTQEASQLADMRSGAVNWLKQNFAKLADSQKQDSTHTSIRILNTLYQIGELSPQFLQGNKDDINGLWKELKENSLKTPQAKHLEDFARLTDVLCRAPLVFRDIVTAMPQVMESLITNGRDNRFNNIDLLSQVALSCGLVGKLEDEHLEQLATLCKDKISDKHTPRRAIANLFAAIAVKWPDVGKNLLNQNPESLKPILAASSDPLILIAYKKMQLLIEANLPTRLNSPYIKGIIEYLAPVARSEHRIARGYAAEAEETPDAKLTEAIAKIEAALNKYLDADGEKFFTLVEPPSTFTNLGIPYDLLLQNRAGELIPIRLNLGERMCLDEWGGTAPLNDHFKLLDNAVLKAAGLKPLVVLDLSIINSKQDTTLTNSISSQIGQA